MIWELVVVCVFKRKKQIKNRKNFHHVTIVELSASLVLNLATELYNSNNVHAHARERKRERVTKFKTWEALNSTLVTCWKLQISLILAYWSYRCATLLVLLWVCLVSLFFKYTNYYKFLYHFTLEIISLDSFWYFWMDWWTCFLEHQQNITKSTLLMSHCLLQT